ncbi:hypothetical protein [Actinoplanes sp. NPDC089786]|uniref:hypothetical protein n=1 Tax=Actinoplanes sp. NPDC089786 TaxID=3155185 RepID=UPI003430DFED
MTFGIDFLCEFLDSQVTEPPEEKPVGILAALRTAEGTAFAELLERAGGQRIPLSCDEIGPAADDFVRFWARHPELGYEPRDWPCGTDLENRLRAHLGDRIEKKAIDARVGGDAWWRQLRVKDPCGALDAAMLGARMASVDGATRAAIVAEQVGRAADESRFRALGRCLWRWVPATADELRVFVLGAPDDVEIEPAPADDFLDDRVHAGTLCVADLDLIGAFVAAGRLRPADLTARLLAAHTVVGDVISRLGAMTRHDDGWLADSLGQVHPGVVTAHGERLVQALLAVTVPATVASIVMVLPAGVRRTCLAAVTERLRGDPAPALVAAAVVISDWHDRDEQLDEAVRAWLGGAACVPGALAAVDALLDRRGSVNAYARWMELRGLPAPHRRPWFRCRR